MPLSKSHSLSVILKQDGRYKMNIELLKSEMKKRKLSEGDIAKAINVSMQTVESWLVGRYKPSERNGEALCYLLGVSCKDLLNADRPPWEDKQPPKPPKMCHTMQAALMIQDKVNDVIISLAMDRDINGAIKLCAEIMDDLEAEYL